MKISELFTHLRDAQIRYATGGAGWQITTGVQRADSYISLESFSAGGVCIYAWIGSAEHSGDSDCAERSEFEITVHARGIVIADQSSVGHTSACLIDDLCAMLLTMNMIDGYSVVIQSIDEPVLLSTKCDVHVQAIVHCLL